MLLPPRLRAGDADAAIDDMKKRLGAEIAAITLPKSIEPSPAAEAIVKQVLDLCHQRIESMD